MPDPVLAQLAALKTAPIGALRQKWRELFEREPPLYNRRYEIRSTETNRFAHPLHRKLSGLFC